LLISAGHSSDVKRVILQIHRARTKIMRPHSVHFTLRKAMVIIAILALFLAFVVVPLVSEIERSRRRQEYKRVVSGMNAAIFALKTRVPPGLDPARWSAAVELTAVAHFNAFYLRHPPTLQQAYRLRGELMPKLTGPVDMQTLAWTWDRIRQTGADGRAWTDRHEPEFRKFFAPGEFTVQKTAPLRQFERPEPQSNNGTTIASTRADSIPSDFRIVAQYGAGFMSDWKSWKNTITGDGNVIQETHIFSGGEWKTIPRRTAVSSKDIRELIAKVDEVRFDALPKRKSYSVTDNPTLALTITRNRQTHEAGVYAPHHLKADHEVQRLLRLWTEILRKVPSPNPDDKPELWEPEANTSGQATDRKHNNDQPPHAEPQESSPGT
jgi:hypothetical protein